MTAYEKVQAARAKNRLTAVDFIRGVFEGFVEMHGDRRFGDDRAVVCGPARLEGRPVTVIGIEKGKDVKEKAARNFGSPHPEGYRKALRQMKLAEKFGRPVICLVDTAGAFCGLEAEQRGQGQAISENLMELMGLKVPVLSLIIGEGGSGGALALAVANQVWMLENAVYSVISPEGCASILWRDASRVKEASECLKLTAPDLLALGIIERIIPEGATLFEDLKAAFSQTLTEYDTLSPEDLTDARYERFRRIGDLHD